MANRSKRIWISVFVVLLGSTSACDSLPDPGALPPGQQPLLTTARVDVTVQLPAGIPFASDQLALRTILGDAPISDTGAAVATVFTGGPQLATVFSPDGSVLLMGWIDPPGRTVVSAATTAEVLLFFDLGGWLLTNDLRGQLVEQVPGMEAVAGLTNAVSEALATAPHHLDVAGLDAKRAPMAAKRMPDHAATAALIVNPSDALSGIRLNQSELDTVVITNSYRRRAMAFIQRVESPASEGAPPTLVDFRTVNVSPPVGATSLVGSLVDLLGGRVAYGPVDSEPVRLPRVPEDAEETRYKVTAIGLGLHAGEEASLSAAQRAELRTLIAKSLIIDLFAPVVANTIVPLRGEAMDRFLLFFHGSDLLGTVVAAFGSTYPNILDQAASGDVRGATLALWNAVLADPSFRVLVIDAIITGFSAFAESGFGSTSAQRIEIGNAANFAEHVLAVVALNDALLTAFDASVQAVHIGLSKRAETWDVVVVPSRVSISPQRADVGKYDTVNFTASVSAANNGSGDPPPIVYKWSVTGNRGTISDSARHRGRSFETSHDLVAFAPNPSDLGDEEIVVEAFEIVGSERRALGRASAKIVTRDVMPTIVPRRVSVPPGSPGGGQSFQVGVDGTLQDGGTLSYVWTAEGGHGMFENASTHFESDASSMGWRAWSESEAMDHVRVEVISTKDGVRKSLGTARAEVRIEKPERQTIMFGSRKSEGYVRVDGNWYESGCGTYVGVPNVPGAKRLDVYCYNFNDTAYWGRSISRSFDPKNPGDALVNGEFRVGLTGGVGFGPIDPNAPPPEFDQQACHDSFEWRFSGMIVEVTVTYE